MKVLIFKMNPLKKKSKSIVMKNMFVEFSNNYTFHFFRKSCASFYDGKELFVAGGATAELDSVCSVERFSPANRRWEMVDNLPKGLAASVTAVVAQMPVRLMSNYRELAQSNMS